MPAEPQFTLKQLVAGCSVVAALGAGGAYTLSAQDALQDERIYRNTGEIMSLRSQVSEISQAVMQTKTTLGRLEVDVNEIKDDTKENQRLLNRVLGRREPVE